MIRDRDIPAWPEFIGEYRYDHRDDGKTFYVAATNTGRPGTPIFRIALPVDGAMPEAYVKDLVREELEAVYHRVHPNGCPTVSRS